MTVGGDLNCLDYVLVEDLGLISSLDCFDGGSKHRMGKIGNIGNKI